MKNIEYLTVIFACCVIFSIFYWQIFHFVILKQIRFQLFALRDQARSIAAQRELGNSESFDHVERFICKTISFSPRISLTSFLLFAAMHHKEMLGDVAFTTEIEKFEKEAPKELVEIKQATAKFSLIVMALNSPWMMFFGFIFALVLVALGKITRTGLYRQTEKFVENIVPEPGECLQPA